MFDKHEIHEGQSELANRLRIAYVTNSTEGGGAALPIPLLTRVLRDLGAEIRVFALEKRDSRALPYLIAAGLDPLVRTGGKHDHFAALRWLDAETRAWGATHLWTSLSRSAALGLLIARRRKIPTYCRLMNALPKTGNRLILRILQRHARAWIADSDSTARVAREVLHVEDSRLLVWPTFAANPHTPIAAAWRPGDPLRLGSLGRLHPVKGYDVLISALARLRQAGFHPPVPFTVTIGGDGTERAKLEASLRSAGVREMLLPGYIDQPQQFLAGLHLYLQPSRSEGMCIAAHEAMAAALPVLVSAVGELPHSVVPGVTGITVPPANVVALAEGLHRLLSRPEQLQHMGATARLRILERYSEERFVAAGTALFNRMVTASAAGHTTSLDRFGPRA
ncbi:MAG: glycosyltransferase family 4 protein [Steroidobacteraceae bacterium]